jgi:putative ABC transport system substrate-binding protein
MRRRAFITLLGGAAAWPLAARAQQAVMPVIGFLSGGSANEYAEPLRAFREGLGQIGYMEGRNVAVEYRWAEGQSNRLPELAADLVRRQVSVIVVDGLTPALAITAATATIPIVFSVGGDPVADGLVASMNRPGKNVTGFTSLNSALHAKRLELLHELIPAGTIIVQLLGGDVNNTQTTDAQAAARALGLQIHILHASAERDFDAVFAAVAELRAGGLAIGTSPVFNNQSGRLAALAARRAVPTISPYRAFAAAGGLMSYGDDLIEQYHKVSVYAGRILKGEKPGDLPVQQAAKIELTLNLQAAKALGITFPLTLLGRADEVIE